MVDFTCSKKVCNSLVTFSWRMLQCSLVRRMKGVPVCCFMLDKEKIRAGGFSFVWLANLLQASVAELFCGTGFRTWDSFWKVQAKTHTGFAPYLCASLSLSLSLSESPAINDDQSFSPVSPWFLIFANPVSWRPILSFYWAEQHVTGHPAGGPCLISFLYHLLPQGTRITNGP